MIDALMHVRWKTFCIITNMTKIVDGNEAASVKLRDRAA
jgi:hypothetical protein